MQYGLTNKAEELIQVCLTLVPEHDLLLVSFIHGEKEKPKNIKARPAEKLTSAKAPDT